MQANTEVRQWAARGPSELCGREQAGELMKIADNDPEVHHGLSLSHRRLAMANAS